MYEKDGDTFKATVEGDLLYMIRGDGACEILIKIKTSEIPDLVKSLKERTSCSFGESQELQVVTHTVIPYLKLNDGRRTACIGFTADRLEVFINYLENKISE